MNWIKNKTLRQNWFSRRKFLLTTLVIGWMGSVCSFFLSLMTGWYFDLMYQESISKSALLADFGLQVKSIQDFFLIMALVILTKLIFHFWERQLIRTQAEDFNFNLMRQLFARQLRWKPQYFAKNGFGKYLLRYSGDQLSIRSMLCNGFHRGLKDILFLITGFALLIYLNLFWTLTLLVTFLLVSPVAWLLDRKQLPWTQSKRSKKSLVLKYVTETFAKHHNVLSSHERKRKVNSFEKKSLESVGANLTYQRWDNARIAWVGILGPLFIFALLASISIAPDTKGSPGELLAFLLVIGAMVPAFRNISKSPSIITKGMISLEKIELLLRKKTPLTWTEESNTNKPILQKSELLTKTP